MHVVVMLFKLPFVGDSLVIEHGIGSGDTVRVGELEGSISFLDTRGVCDVVTFLFREEEGV